MKEHAFRLKFQLFSCFLHMCFLNKRSKMYRQVNRRVIWKFSDLKRFNSTVSDGSRKLNEKTNIIAPPALAAESVSESVVAPPTFFHNQTILPEKKIEVETHVVNTEEPIVPPPVVPPRPVFSTSDGKAQDARNYFQSYKDFCKGMAYIGIGMGTMFFLFDQYERLDESEKQMKMMKKKQKELVVQMQNYKNKLNKIAIDNARQNVITQGKMQMHIALLRQQLKELGMEPVDIEKAVLEFEHHVKIDVVGNRVELWVPGETELKRLIPDPHEYNQKR